MTTTTMIDIRQPDDWHLHIRDGEFLPDLLKHTSSQFARAVIMPNLKPPVVNVEMALQYRQRIVAALPTGSTFRPLMALYLTDNTSTQEVLRAKEAGMIGFKLYPAGATTNSDAGVTEIGRAHV